MSDLRELYQELILDHNRQPRNFGPLPDANHQADGYNPLCGDRVTVFVRTADEVIQAVTFDGAGCAISTASAGLGIRASTELPPSCRSFCQSEKFTGLPEHSTTGGCVV